jgi:hypothetical protein
VSLGSCEIVALRENFVDSPESYDSFSAKLYISCARKKAHALGYISPSLHRTCSKARYENIPKTFSYNSRSITNLTNICLRPEQP